MFEPRTLCDRCGAECRDGVSVLKPRGPIRRYLGPVEVCPACSASFLGWLAEPDSDEPETRSRRNPRPVPTPSYLAACSPN